MLTILFMYGSGCIVDCNERTRYMHGTCTEDTRREHAPHSVNVAKIKSRVKFAQAMSR